MLVRSQEKEDDDKDDDEIATTKPPKNCQDKFKREKDGQYEDVFSLINDTHEENYRNDNDSDSDESDMEDTNWTGTSQTNHGACCMKLVVKRILLHIGNIDRTFILAK